ncbi:hypothetical protein CcaverHIS631_0508540 [Cutaneotrichosporon cavernicola]|nr:hypothetical protein CcaverHIS631_0508540 [Cutaneotrichosporon cavernicola]BEJ08763.1 hypothetical protein CcaverHIS641_0508570 [Cutaneotrichosporon cavernicola]
MSSKQRGTKRAAEAPASGPKNKSFKPSGGKDFRGKPGTKPAGKFGKPDGKFGKPAGKFDKPAGKFGKPAGRFDKPGQPNKFGKPAGKPAKKEDEPARRKRPVTQGGGDEDVDMSGDEGDDFEEQGEGEVEGEGEGEGEAVPEEKRGKMSKTERAALHAAQPHRKTLLPSHALLTETLLPLWETARRLEMPKDERTAAITALWEAVQGHALEISRGHKGGRILQTIVKYGGKEERLGVAMELQPKWREMMESKYSKFLMGKLIRYCPSIRPLLVPVIAKNLGSLLSHADAVQPISDFYDLWASAKERRGLVRGFYPREVELFDGGKEGDFPGLEGALETTGESGRLRVLEGIEKVVTEIFNATQKTALAQPIFHRLVSEYLTCIYRFLPAEDAGKKMHELLDVALESLPEIVHTKDGSAVVRDLLVRGNAKDRKSILQHLRKHVSAIAKDADAQLVLFTAFDVVDDTKLMSKAFVSDVVGLAHELAQDKNGRRAVLYLVVPTASRHFLPSTLASLATAAQTAKDIGTSKKDPVVRRREILSAASPGLLTLVADKAEEMVRDPGSGLLVTEILLHTSGDKSAAIEALTAPLATPYGDEHVLHLPHATRTYKTLLSGGHFSQATKAIDVVAPELGSAMGVSMWRAISQHEGNAIQVAAGAPFVMVELLAAIQGSEVADEAKATLTSAEAIEAVEASEMKGANVLLERIQAL